MLVHRFAPLGAFLVLGATPALAQRAADTVITADTARQLRVREEPDDPERPYRRLRPAQALGLVELGAFGQATRLDTGLGGTSPVGGGGRIGALLPFGLEAEVEASVGSMVRAAGGPRDRYVPVAARLLSNWDYGNRSSMFFGAGVVRARYGDISYTGPSGIVGFRVGEGVALRVDGVVNYMPEVKARDISVRAGVSLLLGPNRRTGTPPTVLAVTGDSVLTITRTVTITRVDTVTRTEVAAANDGGTPGGGAPRAAARGGARSSFSGAGVTVYFGFDQASLTPEARTLLTRFGERLRGDDALGAVITGHADQCGSPATNAALSRRRALAAQRYLVDSVGILPERIVATGVGTQQLLEERTVPSSRAPRSVCAADRNRRAEARVTLSEAVSLGRPGR